MTEHRLSLQALAAKLALGAHSIFSPSGSHMWLACSGSLIPNVLAQDAAGPDAAYGTVAHGVTETWLRNGRRPDHLIGMKEWVEAGEWGYLIEIDEEMLHYAQQCVDRSEWMPGDQLVEYRVDFSHLTPIPHQGGTLDFAAMLKKRAYLDDHKFGSAPDNIVYAEENPQLMIYALGLHAAFGEQYGFEDFVLRINQPRLNHFDEWATTRKRLLEFGDYVRERAAAAWQLDAPRTPGAKQCRFCKVKATCAANARLQAQLTEGVFGDSTTQSAEQMESFAESLDSEDFTLNFEPTGNLTTNRLVKLLPFRGMAEAWWASLEAELNKRAAAGDMPKGMKFVEGRTKRQFKSEAKAREHLEQLGLPRDKIVKEKTVSPAQAEKLLLTNGYKRSQLPELLSDLVYKPPGRATLVPLSDKRPAVEDVTSLVFEDVETHEPQEEL